MQELVETYKAFLMKIIKPLENILADEMLFSGLYGMRLAVTFMKTGNFFSLLLMDVLRILEF